MKKPTRWPLSKKDQKTYEGWVVIYNADTKKILSLEKIDKKRTLQDLRRVEKLFNPFCQPRCKKQPCRHHHTLVMKRINKIPL